MAFSSSCVSSLLAMAVLITFGVGCGSTDNKASAEAANPDHC